MSASTRYWLGVVSRDHVLRGAGLGIAQIDHGNRAALGRMAPGDGLVYYSPRKTFPKGPALKAFTALADGLDLTARPNWGYQLRRGLVELSSSDFDPIRSAMTARR